MKKIIIIILSLMLAGGCLAEESIGIIGGADGPTSIYISSEYDLNEEIEKHMKFTGFRDMTNDELTEVTSLLRDLPEFYEFSGRTCGEYAYVTGVLTSENSPLEGLAQPRTVVDKNGVQYVIDCIECNDIAFIFEGVMPVYDPSSPNLIVIIPDEYTDYDAKNLFEKVVRFEFDYINSAYERGIRLAEQEAPYAYVHYVENGTERLEYVPLTQDELMSGYLSSTVITEDEIGVKAVGLKSANDTPYDDMYAYIPEAIYDIVADRCGISAYSPDDISDIASVEMALDGQNQAITDAAILNEITEIIKSANMTEFRRCPYDAQITVNMTNGETVTIQKATDVCGTMIFGNTACYEIPVTDSNRLWEIFDGIEK